MSKRLPRLLIALVLASSVGLHWAFLQSFAWTTMLVDNLKTTSFSVAVQRTFDGKHPCVLCKAIAEGKKSDRKSDTIVPLKKMEALNQATANVVGAFASFPTIKAQEAWFVSLLYAPLTPPPRAT